MIQVHVSAQVPDEGELELLFQLLRAWEGARTEFQVAIKIVGSDVEAARAIALTNRLLEPPLPFVRVVKETPGSEGAPPAPDPTGPTYRISAVRGVPAIECLLCNRISELPGDVEHAYCGRCHLFLELVADCRRSVALGSGHDCGEWRTFRDVCALCGRALEPPVATR